eukprot:CAMPEP_0194508062 /NCGR_PEP_ID=MMETSP0253-20130528/37953_1 /TAXON_ID=2966 /ORGANISM="Noctiluca scintillans" /LENGTH=372 /DNA_ID=CAMNT_0039351035 /DNA_START=76 /DNA_END=1196 /DNA_ORIENTATION=-
MTSRTFELEGVLGPVYAWCSGKCVWASDAVEAVGPKDLGLSQIPVAMGAFSCRVAKSTILRAIRLPLMSLIAFAAVVLILNRCIMFFFGGSPLLTLPQTPLSLQSSSIGLLLVFRTNQTHDRLREGQKVVGRLGSVAKEIVQMLVIHAPGAPVTYLTARLLGFFGWGLKGELRGNVEKFAGVAKRILPASEVDWILRAPTHHTMLRLRASIGSLFKEGILDKEVFKFIEDDLARLGDIVSTCDRLSTFPIPPSYHRHGSRAIILWICTLPFALEGRDHHCFATLITVFITGFVILGLDAIAIEIEQPFDVLPLHEFARGMSQDVSDVLAGWCDMPPVPHCHACTVPEACLEDSLPELFPDNELRQRTTNGAA